MLKYCGNVFATPRVDDRATPAAHSLKSSLALGTNPELLDEQPTSFTFNNVTLHLKPSNKVHCTEQKPTTTCAYHCFL